MINSTDSIARFSLFSDPTGTTNRRVGSFVLRDRRRFHSVANASVPISFQFEACRSQAGEERFAEVMPFGHAVFASVESETDLYFLWHQELKRMLRRPNTPRHELYETIADNFPWKDSTVLTVLNGLESTNKAAGEADDGIDGSAAS